MSADGQLVDLTAKPPESAAGREPRRWPTLWLGDANGERGADPVVDDIIHAGTVGEFYGAPGTLKTMLALNLSAHVGTPGDGPDQGLTWFGHRTRLRSSVYVAAEGGGGIERRLAALRIEHASLPPENLVAIRAGVNLLEESEVDDFGEQIIRELMPRLGAPLGLVHFDTLSQSLPGGDENATKDFTYAERNLRRLIARIAEHQDGTSPAVSLVHHVGHAAQNRPRGTSSQHGNLDWLLCTERVDTEAQTPLSERVFSVRAIKVKDGPDGVSWSYRAALVQVGTRCEDGKSLYAPVLRHEQQGLFEQALRAPAKKVYRPKPGSMTALVWEAIPKIIARDGRSMVPEAVIERSGYRAEAKNPPRPGEIWGVFRTSLHAYVEAASGGGGSEGERVKGASDENRRNEAIRALVSRGLLCAFEEWVWVAQQ